MVEDRPRSLGVVEALVATRDQCPNGAVRRCAEQALEAIKTRLRGWSLPIRRLFISVAWRYERFIWAAGTPTVTR